MGKALVGTRDGTGTGLATGQESAIRDALDASRAGSTTRVYGSAWTRFVLWADAQGYDPLPAAPETVAAYLADRAASRTFPRFRPSGPRRHPYRAH